MFNCPELINLILWFSSVLILRYYRIRLCNYSMIFLLRLLFLNKSLRFYQIVRVISGMVWPMNYLNQVLSRFELLNLLKLKNWVKTYFKELNSFSNDLVKLWMFFTIKFLIKCELFNYMCAFFDIKFPLINLHLKTLNLLEDFAAVRQKVGDFSPCIIL
jgi:hypothetical protein